MSASKLGVQEIDEGPCRNSRFTKCSYVQIVANCLKSAPNKAAAPVAVALLVFASTVKAQTIIASPSDLPDAPGFSGQATGSDSTTGTAAIYGIVVDVNATPVPNARVTLASINVDDRVIKTGDDGAFSFDGLASRSYRVLATADGLESFLSNEVRPAQGKRIELPLIVLRVTPTTSEVTVTVTEEELAHEELKAEEKQRVLGILPNFYVSYIWHPAPMKPKQKFELATRSVIDPVAFISTGITAAVEQAHNTFPGYGSGPKGYAKRYGAAYADITISRFLSSAILPSLFHQDPRYFFHGSGSIAFRTLYAISMAVVTRGDNGRWQPNYSHVIGNFATAGISNIYRTGQDRSAGLTIRNGFIITGSNGLSNVIREFISRKLTPKVPSYNQGKPPAKKLPKPNK